MALGKLLNISVPQFPYLSLSSELYKNVEHKFIRHLSGYILLLSNILILSIKNLLKIPTDLEILLFTHIMFVCMESWFSNFCVHHFYYISDFFSAIIFFSRIHPSYIPLVKIW